MKKFRKKSPLERGLAIGDVKDSAERRDRTSGTEQCGSIAAGCNIAAKDVGGILCGELSASKSDVTAAYEGHGDH